MASTATTGQQGSTGKPPQWFATTHWSMVLAARGSESGAALERLCRVYWYPLYAFVRRQGYSFHDAEELTQGFFAKFLEKDYLDDVDRRKGKFRSFLLAAIKHYLSDERDKARAQKRGGGRVVVSLDAEDAEKRYQMEPAHELTPEKLFERRWALALLVTVFERLREDYVHSGRGDLFAVIQGFLVDEPTENPTHASAAGQLGMKEGAVRKAVHRLRRRYGDLFREEVAHTVSDPSEIEEEMRALRKILSSG